MLKLPLVSFIVTSFNYQNYIQKTIESIKAQSYENIEIIVVDDYSSDNSVKILEAIDDIKLIKHDENKGQTAAFITGLAEAKGQFVCFVDSDDILVKDYAKTLVKIHLATSCAFVSSQIVEIDAEDNILTTYSNASFQNKLHNELKNLNELLFVDVENIDFKLLNTKTSPFGGWYWCPTSSAMFRRAAIEPFLMFEDTQNWKICPDKLLFNFAHLIGGSALCYAPLVAKRRHSANAGYSDCIVGNKKYNNDMISKLNIENNKKIRQSVLKFISKNEKYFIEKFGKTNVLKLRATIYLSYFHLLTQLFNKFKI